MATTALPTISGSKGANRNWTPGPAYLPGSSQRDPILGTVRPYQKQQFQRILPDIYQRNFNKNTRYEPKVIMIIDHKTGKKMEFKLPGLESRSESRLDDEDKGEKRTTRSSFPSNIHERSVFETTNRSSSYFIIHPDWTSEMGGRKKLHLKQRNHYSWDGRPSVHPLSAYIDPLLEKRRLRDQYLKSLDQAKHIEKHSASQNSQYTKMRMMKPMTPKDKDGNFKGFSMY